MTFKDLAAQLSTAIQTLPNLIQVLREGFQEVEAGSDVEVTQIVTTGTEIANIKVGDDPAVSIYAPGATGGIDYSTDEQDTGIKWTDGKSIYQRTITGLSLTGNFGNWLTMPGTYTWLDKTVGIATGYYYGSGTSITFPCAIYYDSNTKGMLILPYNKDISSKAVKSLTIQYTKS